jgi:hypothetical protein
MRKTFTAITMAMALALSVMGAAIASTTTTISEPTIHYQAGDPVVEIVDKDGTGALFLSTPDGADKAQVVVDGFAGNLDDLESLSYRTFREEGATGQQIASINIITSPWTGTYVYEPVYDSSATVVDGVWQTWDAFSDTARWWNSNDPDSFVTWEQITDGVSDVTGLWVLVNQGSGNAGLMSYVDYVEVNGDTYAFGPETVEPGAITAPTTGQQITVGDTLELRAHDVAAAGGGVQWAVRQGTSQASRGAVAGNVDGFSDAFSWENGVFSADVATGGWDAGEYYFVFNPREGDRLYVSFELVVTEAPPVTLDGKDECKRGGWERSENPEFRNQGQCVSYFVANENAGK